MTKEKVKAVSQSKEARRKREIIKIVENTLKLSPVDSRVYNISECCINSKMQRANLPDSGTSYSFSEPERRRQLIANTDAQIQM